MNWARGVLVTGIRQALPGPELNAAVEAFEAFVEHGAFIRAEACAYRLESSAGLTVGRAIRELAKKRAH